MRFLTRLLSVFIFVGWAGYSYAYEMEVNWQQEGSSMRFQILSVNSGLPESQKVDCGLFSQCTVHVRIWLNTVYKFPSIPSMRGKQSITKLAKVWAASSPRGVIYNWSELVEKNGGQAPCLVFDMNGSIMAGGTFAATCDGNVTPPPMPKPPEPPVSCYVGQGIYLQHGSLADSEVPGNRANATAYVYCTGNAKVRVRALASVGSDNYMVNLRADGSLKSLLTVNNVVGNGGVVLDVPGGSTKEVMFSSSLVTSGTPAPGGFSGSAVAVVDIL
ncbi:MrpH family fimbial adhesin [Serratia entomophila]|uniref:MrpH family fimbial adhesin n=1 Tax=Serratia entomophila TaxID=42906 RepID=UPI002178D9CE|nr:hypothetical protein [Serratia entomophila]CAI0883108.1 Uncharacterised protein [Serratia entomophila]CAI0955331.1 Uncharacterised protein [Serratia entomophila]CAI1011499.1 Uncharacterised protein [Serratia entomophila]CAI1012043.1 Uncharacterised protein [Serratia entomophila]CAI1730786.1 Uncharacterised protein [Serratia entomophila]